MPTNVSHAGCATKRAGDTTSARLYSTSYAEQSGREFTICKTADGRSRNGTSNSRLDSTMTEDDPHLNGGPRSIPDGTNRGSRSARTSGVSR